MSSSIFRFKQFEISHEKSAMKVGTDGVLLGAWANTADVKSILDVGTGSGLIALMLAQRNKEANIHAIDISNDAVEQATINFNNSDWKNRLTVELVDFKTLEKKELFDLIVSNPPFFENSFKSNLIDKNLARHADVGLNTIDLLQHSTSRLTTEGKLALILPVEQAETSIKQAVQCKLFLTRLTKIYPTPEKEAHRYLMEFSKTQTACAEDKLIIEEFGRHLYSKEYIEITKDFYLKFPD